MVKPTSLMLSFVTALLLSQGYCHGTSSDKKFDSTNGYDIRTMNVKHPTAYIVQMCYTKTVDENGKAHNPCFACHVQNRPPNYVYEDDGLQAAYDFPATAQVNPNSNNFKDFSKAVKKISDEEIIKYVNQSNYFDANRTIILANKLRHLPKTWDFNGDGVWSGYIPDCYYNFDKNGFDHSPDGKPTGWVAFAYMPFLGTFWPTNGSTDDVLIRLDKPFRQLIKSDKFNPTVYKVNLAIVESLIKRKNISINLVDENMFGVDLNKDGKLDTASQITYDWAPNKGRYMSYVGYAKTLQEQGLLHLAAGLYPEGTEFLHSVRYIKSSPDGNISVAPRMKELRYGKKLIWLTYADLKNKGSEELKEADLDDSNKIETFRGNMETGLGNNLGWVYQGFIENKYGNLRPDSYEETLSCMGCHSGIGVITDSTFAFPRKLDNFRHGWYHWSKKHYLKGIPERKYSDGTWEFTHYLKLNSSGNEFRTNKEVKNKFFLKDGKFNSSAIERLHKDVSELLYPSYKRAIMLDKAYRAIVETQLFIDGKAAHIKPLKNVYKSVQSGKSTHNKIYNPPTPK